MKPTLTSLNCKSRTSKIVALLEMLACKLNYTNWKHVEALKMYGLEKTNLVRLDLEVFALLEAVEICITKLQIHEN
jgi:hypothetical protein